MTLSELGEKAEAYVIDLLEGRCRGRLDRALRVLLFVLSRGYRGAVQLRLALFNEGLLRRHTPGCLVVSIGNLTVGGTGKTPVVEVFARTLAAKGRKVAVLSRGYRSKRRPLPERLRDMFRHPDREIPPRCVSDGKRLLMDSAMGGDEPYMLASNLPDVCVLVDKDRVKASRYAIRQLGCDTLLLDDGYQYLALRPRLNILLVDATNPFHNHHLLPRGFLREPIKNVRRADFVFLTKCNGSPSVRHLRTFIRKHNPRAEIIECTHRPRHLVDVYTGERHDLETLRGKRLAAICAIACPESFEAFLRQLGGELVHCERYVDHHRYDQREVINFINASLSRQADLVLTTEKDAVRFPKLDRRDLPVYYLRVEIDILSGRETFDDCITRICFL
ncbi:MAG: Tetraacyldisaccharide 4'-kinase [Lentisphaerae bacterium ADurb.BinA184]|nr:MAG: Tetraacyldisaccharide 4'-kinase [Lentisphaerae bacterium ADurb.BinA184]